MPAREREIPNYDPLQDQHCLYTHGTTFSTIMTKMSSKNESTTSRLRQYTPQRNTSVNLYKDVQLRKGFSSLVINKKVHLEPIENIKVKEVVMRREACLLNLMSVCETYMDSGNENLIDKHERGILYTLDKLRLVSLEAIEAIVEWRNHTTPIRSYLWKGLNYLLRIQVLIEALIISIFIFNSHC